MEDAKEAINFIKEQIEQHVDKINVVPTDPYEFAVEEMIKSLSQNCPPVDNNTASYVY